MDDASPTPQGHGWVEFAGIFYIVAAVINGIGGIAMLSKPALFDGTRLLTASLSFWGTIAVVVAVVQVLLAVLILMRTTFGRIAGIVFGVFALGLWTFTIFVAPFLAIVNVALYAALLYGMTAHRDEFRHG